jgi:oligopeptide transport system permease protein
MLKYAGKRLGMGIVTIFVLITVTFFLTRYMPGNPFEAENLSPEVLEQLQKEYGLDNPPVEQFRQYLIHMFQGSLGSSFKKSGVTVTSMIARGAGPTIRLGLITFVLAMVIGIPLGVWMAATKREAVRGALLAGTTAGVSIPNIIVAILLMTVFGVRLGWFPVIGLDGPANYVLPVLTMLVYPVSQISRLMQSSFSEALSQDYVVMARAKGLAPHVIIIRHVLKNAMIPIITIAGPMFAFMITGSFVTESIFTIPGMGKEFTTAVTNRDYPIIMGLTIFVGILVIVFNLISDLICSAADPRIKLND